jgi:hypothetical protein
MKVLIKSGIILTLFAHSFCCLLPLLGMLVGINVLGNFLHGMAPFLILLNVVFIIIGFFVSRYHNSDGLCGHKHCRKNKISYIKYSVGAILLMAALHFLH